MEPRASAGGIILNADKKLVLVNQHNNSWSFPKGGIEAGESTLEAATREIGEEAGITDLTLVAELGSYARYSLGKDGKSENLDWGLRPRTIFLFTTKGASTTPTDPDHEITGMRWVTLDEAMELLTHPKDKEFLQSVRAKVEDALK